MNVGESLRVALRGLANNKLRTGLTMLGIIIGVGVVILVVAIGQGAAARIKATVDALGTNMIMVWPERSTVKINAATSPTNTNTTTTVSSSGTAVTTTSSPSLGATTHLTLQDAELIGKSFPQSIAAVAPQVRADIKIRLGSNDSTSNATGATVQYPLVNNVSVMRGRFFNQQEVDSAARVVVCGATVADKLLGDPSADLTGQTIQINSQAYKVLGMLTPKGAGTWGQDQDDVCLVPITTAMTRISNQKYISFLSVRATTAKMIPLAQEEIANLLRNRHHLRPPFPQNDDFHLFSQTELLQRQQSVTSTMTSMLSAVAVISLLIGGIGIMNIMLVSVTERTREIGIRKAIGATPHDIMLQFLIESSIISLIGGLIGIILGCGGAFIMASMGWSALINPTSVVVAVVVSAAVGIFFGIYPASKAAALNPIEALRYE
ncbi:MAG: ABC transporter permease [Armatimonadetes bacterium]|nr:ABC transporter permease [Armatimonadota bacterium]MDE2205704.1 ABC transporter permease [Armatimonadota bacterium]